MIRVKEVIALIEQKVPLSYQETYDNSGLLVGDVEQEVTGILCALDCSMRLLEEAVEKKCNLVITHHPLIFRPIDKLTKDTYVGGCVYFAIKNNLAIYGLHTNLDNMIDGVNYAVGKVLGLERMRLLCPKKHTDILVTVYAPRASSDSIRRALHEAGGGHVGCSFTGLGKGRYKPSDNANPFMGKVGVLEEVNEERVEVVFPVHLQHKAVDAIKASHPYETPVYFLQGLENNSGRVGSGMIGYLPQQMTQENFLAHVKKAFSLSMIRHTLCEQPIRKVAICGGAGGSLVGHALAQGADAFLTADIRYHTFFDVQGKIFLADIGHYESEIIIARHIQRMLVKQFGEIIYVSDMSGNPVHYY